MKEKEIIIEKQKNDDIETIIPFHHIIFRFFLISIFIVNIILPFDIIPDYILPFGLLDDSISLFFIYLLLKKTHMENKKVFKQMVFFGIGLSLILIISIVYLFFIKTNSPSINAKITKNYNSMYRYETKKYFI